MIGYPKKIFLNGEIVGPEAAKISVFDRGFIFGDGLYEVMVQIGGHFFYEEAHLNRLRKGLQKVHIDFDINQIKPAMCELLAAAELTGKDCLLYIQITRGIAPRQHHFPKDIQPSIMMYVIPKILPKINTVHAKVITRQDFRWSRCDIKMTSLLGNVMLNEEAVQSNCFETVLVREGVVTEASHCNVFFVKDKTVYTHPANTFILDGISRQVVIELCHQLHIKLKENPVPESLIPKMDEAFLTGTSTQIASIRQIDNHQYYTGEATGGTTRKLQEAFFKLKNRVII